MWLSADPINGGVVFFLISPDAFPGALGLLDPKRVQDVVATDQFITVSVPFPWRLVPRGILDFRRVVVYVRRGFSREL